MEQQYQYIFNIFIIAFLIIGVIKFYEFKNTVETLKKMFEEIEKRLSRILEEIESVLKENKKLKEHICQCKKHVESDNHVIKEWPADNAKSAAKFIKDMCAENESCAHCPFRQRNGLCVLSINQDGISNGYTPDTWKLD